jgi:hypothetical protein
MPHIKIAGFYIWDAEGWKEIFSSSFSILRA